MRTPRIKISSAKAEATYHCISRIVGSEFLIKDNLAKNVLKKQLRQVADFCGLQILTFAILSNHFHVLVHVPQKTEIPDDELLRRYKILYPKPTVFQTARIDVIAAQLKANSPEAALWRRRQLALMNDVSQFMKLVKQRFSIWYNRNHQRTGTLWSERFKSVLVEGNGRVLETMAAYIDLNPVRAGLCDDPKNYPYCGYSEAVAGNKNARAGLQRITGSSHWNDAQSAYRLTLFGKGSAVKQGAAGISEEHFKRVLKSKGRLTLNEILLCRVRHFTDGAILGTRAFVQKHLPLYNSLTGRRRRTAPRELPSIAEWGGSLSTLRKLRKNPIIIPAHNTS